MAFDNEIRSTVYNTKSIGPSPECKPPPQITSRPLRRLDAVAFGGSRRMCRQNKFLDPPLPWMEELMEKTPFHV